MTFTRVPLDSKPALRHDELWWLLLILAAALAALWLFAVVQLGRASMKRRAAQVS